MDFEHNNLENTDMLSETVDSGKSTEKSLSSKSEPQQDSVNTIEGKGSLFMRRKSQHSSKNEDELKVVIERDNMIVGFVDAVDSDATDDSQSDEENPPLKRKCFKRARSGSPKSLKKVKKSFYYLSSC